MRQHLAKIGLRSALIGLGLGLAATMATAAAEPLPPVYGGPFRKPIQREHANDAAQVAARFTKLGYDLTAVRQSKQAPRIYVMQIPPDLRGLPLKRKTSTFIALMLPQILRANAEVMAQRKALLALNAKKDSGVSLSASETKWLSKLAQAYLSEPDDWADLVMKVDSIPPALALAQAIEESGWGTSRIAILGNALFGELLPPDTDWHYVKALAHGTKFAAFETVLDCVRAYIHNLNIAARYRGLRQIRNNLRKAGKTPSGEAMALGLKHYSSIGMAYVHDLHRIMAENGLKAYDPVSLAPTGGAVLIERVI